MLMIFVKSHPSLSDALTPAAHAVAFAQGVQAMRRTLATTPTGWVFVAWICWERLPHSALLNWLMLFLASWTLGLAVLSRVAREGSDPGRHAMRVLCVAAFDGAAWGFMFVCLTGHDPLLDAWLCGVMTGVAAINAPVYITLPRMFRAQIGCMWLVAILGWTLGAHQRSAVQTVIGLTLFMALLVYYMTGISKRVLEGIQFQLQNTALAEQLSNALALVQQDAATDPLTGVPNRRALDQVMQLQEAMARREGRPFSVLLLDVDHFKSINDTHGHAVGDAALKAFSARVRGLLREGDVCARYGGEEFVVVLPNATLQAARKTAERLRHGVAEQVLVLEPRVAATVSIGVAQFQPGLSVHELLAMADAAVYEAKRTGRNRVSCSPTTQSDTAAVT